MAELQGAPQITFSQAAADDICQVGPVLLRRVHADDSMVLSLAWAVFRGRMDPETGKIVSEGPGFDLGVINRSELTRETIVDVRGHEIAVLLPPDVKQQETVCIGLRDRKFIIQN